MYDLTQIGLYIFEIEPILVVGLIGAHFLKKIHVPHVLGFILIGLILGLLNRFWERSHSLTVVRCILTIPPKVTYLLEDQVLEVILL
ncbi:MAG: hypothetical protein ACTSUR_06415 [Candidatus Heimdallarchaeaceae archaeon]